MQTLSIYMNHRASHGGAENWRAVLDRSLFRSERLYRSPQNLDELHDYLQSDINNNVDALISIGGDGTVNTLIQSLVKKDIGLLVIPGGTANDLAHELGNTKNLRGLIHCIQNDEFKYIDLIRINGRYMATNGGFGLGGDVARKINELRQKFPLFKDIMKFSGSKIYSFFIASELLSLNYDRQKLQIECDEYQGVVECSTMLINNQPVVAGSMNVAPETCNTDGKFNVILTTHKSRQKFIRCVLGIAAGFYPSNDPDFISFETSKLKVTHLEPTRSLNFFGDGEIFDENEKTWDIEIEPRALKVYSRCTEKTYMSLCNEVSLA